MNITKEELDDIRNGTEYTNIRFSKASGNNGQWVRIEGEFKTSLKQRLQKRIIDKKRRMEGCSKDIWNKNNPEKIAKYDLDNKARRIETEGDGYWIKNAEQAKRWRENNPEKVKIINEQRCNDPYVRLNSMKNQAFKKGRKWELFTSKYKTYKILIININISFFFIFRYFYYIFLIHSFLMYTHLIFVIHLQLFLLLVLS